MVKVRNNKIAATVCEMQRPRSQAVVSFFSFNMPTNYAWLWQNGVGCIMRFVDGISSD